MKSAYLLSRSPRFFEAFSGYLKGLDYGLDEAVRSVKISTSDGEYFLLSDRWDGGVFETAELPQSALEIGYRYGFLAECNSEDFFCRIIKASPGDIDFLVFDGNGNIFRSVEVSPDSIIL